MEVDHVVNHSPRIEPDDHSPEASERVGLAAMEGGVDAYNEAIGSPLDDEDTVRFGM